MAWTKAKTAIVVGVVVLLVAGTTTVTVKEIQEHRTYPWQVEIFNSRALAQASPQVRILPAKHPLMSGGWGIVRGKIMGVGGSAKILIQAAYAPTYGSKRLTRIVFLTPLPEGNFDFIASLPNGNAEALQKEIERKFGVGAKLKTIETDALLLTVKSRNAPNLRMSASPNEKSHWQHGNYKVANVPISSLAQVLEDEFQLPVLDRTGLDGNFDFELGWSGDSPQHHNPEIIKQAVLDQLGLELVPSQEPIEMLVVKREN